ncbi:MAG TPA: sigma-70 family RNA polymerase sigma factor [Candidatus Paceibacterota bacterium]|jgi:RNA polymerase sigma factor (sigma-70 family)|nr:sigma-70 family RNA polymerase sigma factor [Candidatus Paceibacterota bacterium]HRZ29715.1 sigma-70 family RNA polymerase sigma factor [Candidatus Paceibacterota bacterium]
MFTIAKNTAIDFIRKKKIIPFSSFENNETNDTFIDQIQDEKINLIEEIIKDDQSSQLSKYITQLNTNQQLVIYLYYYEKMSFREIAELLNISINTIKSQHLRAIASLRQRVKLQ